MNVIDIFAFVLAAIVLIGDVATEKIFTSRAPLLSDKECNLNEVDESFVSQENLTLTLTLILSTDNF